MYRIDILLRLARYPAVFFSPAPAPDKMLQWSRIIQPDNLLTDGNTELNQYLAEPVIPRTNDMLRWWQDNKQRFPLLASMARTSQSCIAPIVSISTTKCSDVDHTELPANTPHLPFHISGKVRQSETDALTTEPRRWRSAYGTSNTTTPW